MKNKNSTLSLFLQANEIDGALEWEVDPLVQGRTQDGIWIYEWEHDPRSRSQIRVCLIRNLGQQSHLLISKVSLNGVQLNNFKNWSRYVAHDGTVISHSHGYINIPGQCIMNIHTNALSHNHMAYFLDCCIGARAGTLPAGLTS